MPPLVSLQRDLCFVEVIEGETDDLERQICESGLVDRLQTSGVALQSVDINAAGCFVLVPCAGVARLKEIARTFNVAIRVHDVCARIALRAPDPGGQLPPLAGLISALHRGGVRTIQIVSSAGELAVIVDAAQLADAMTIVDVFLIGWAPQCVA